MSRSHGIVRGLMCMVLHGSRYTAAQLYFTAISIALDIPNFVTAGPEDSLESTLSGNRIARSGAQRASRSRTDLLIVKKSIPGVSGWPWDSTSHLL